MYIVVVFNSDLRKEDDYSPLIGIMFKNNKKDKLFSLMVQEYGITWSERYKCYILPDNAYFDESVLNQYTSIIDLTIERIKSGYNLDDEAMKREFTQSYYTKNSLVENMAFYINNTSDENSILLDPAAGNGNLTDRIIIPKERIFSVEPNKESADILRKKGYVNVINSTFEEFLKKGDYPKFTHVIMNPPFKDRLDIYFFNECFKLLEDSGRVAAIISENSIYEELEPLGYTFNIDYASSEKVNNFDDLSSLLQEFIDNTHNTKNCFMDITQSFYNTHARAYYLLAEKQLKKNRV